MKRGTGIVLTTALVALAAVLITVFVLQLSSSNKAGTKIGPATFEVGYATRLTNQVPLLFPDLRNQGLDVWVSHTGSDANGGWTTFLAHTPDSRTCAVRWQPKTKTFVDCRGKPYPPDGGDLPHYKTVVDSKGRVVVDFTQ